MAIDHFIKHKAQLGRTDWNFNILFGDQPQVAELAKQYAPLLRHNGLHKPVPSQWLHATVLRMGFLEEFTDQEMLAVAEWLQPKLATIKMPELMLGRWWLWGGNPCLHITPDSPFQEVFDLVFEALRATVGTKRTPEKTRFIPHITLAYSKTYDDELGLYMQLETGPIDSVAIRAKRLSLIKQHIEDDYYAWEIIKEIPIGQS